MLFRSAVCALLLGANPNLVDTGGGTWQVRDAIRGGAEKVHPSTYDYNAYPLEPGRSLEMGYGRLNAMNSLGLVGAPEASTATRLPISVRTSQNSGEICISYDLPTHTRNPEFVLIDPLGRELYRSAIPPSANKQTYSLQGLAAGIYLCFIADSQGRLSSVVRFAYY